MSDTQQIAVSPAPVRGGVLCPSRTRGERTMATSMFLKFEAPAVTGTGTAAGHAGEIEVLSWSHGFVQPTSPTRSTGVVEQATHQNLSFTKYIDSATHELLRLCWSGRQIGKATLTLLRDSEEYLKVVMEHVVITNYSVSGGPGDTPVENISLDYGIVQYVYKEQKVKHDLETRTVH